MIDYAGHGERHVLRGLQRGVGGGAVARGVAGEALGELGRGRAGSAPAPGVAGRARQPAPALAQHQREGQRYVRAAGGLFPRPMARKERAASNPVVGHFRFLGRFIGKALQDDIVQVLWADPEDPDRFRLVLWEVVR